MAIKNTDESNIEFYNDMLYYIDDLINVTFKRKYNDSCHWSKWSAWDRNSESVL